MRTALAAPGVVGLFLGSACFAIASAADAQTQTTASEIVVTGRPLPRSAGAEAYGSVLIDRERLTADASGRLESALRDAAGLETFRRSDARAAHPTAQGASLRGLGGNASSRVLVLLDGVPQADLFAGWIPWPALDPDGLAFARVTRGGGAGPFGAGALGGVVELQSASAAELPVLTARVEGGSRDALGLGLTLAGEVAGGGLTASARRDTGDGWFLTAPEQRGAADRPAAYDQSAASVRWAGPGLGLGELQLAARAFQDRRTRGLPGTQATSLGTDLSARLIGRGALPFEALVYAQDRSFRTRFASADAARAVAAPTLDQYDTPARGWGGKLELRPGALQIGADVRVAEGETRERFRFQGGAFTRDRVAGGRSAVAGVYAERTWAPGETVTATGGVRLDGWRLSDGRWTERDRGDGTVLLDRRPVARTGTEPTARGGLVWRASPDTTVRAAAYRGWRLPTLNELYRPFRVGADATSADPALDPERLTGAEAGVDLRPGRGASLSATVYWNRLEDAVANVTRGVGPGVFPEVGFVGANGVWRRRENVSAVEAAGVELNGSVSRGPWALEVFASLVEAEVRAPGTELDGRRPAQTPRTQASAALRWSPTERVRAYATVRWSGERFEDDLETRRLGSAATLDLSARARLRPGVELEVRGENLFDAAVEVGVSGAGVVERAAPLAGWIGLRVTR